MSATWLNEHRPENSDNVVPWTGRPQPLWYGSITTQLNASMNTPPLKHLRVSICRHAFCLRFFCGRKPIEVRRSPWQTRGLLCRPKVPVGPCGGHTFSSRGPLHALSVSVLWRHCVGVVWSSKRSVRVVAAALHAFLQFGFHSNINPGRDWPWPQMGCF